MDASFQMSTALQQCWLSKHLDAAIRHAQHNLAPFISYSTHKVLHFSYSHFFWGQLKCLGGWTTPELPKSNYDLFRLFNEHYFKSFHAIPVSN